MATPCGLIQAQLAGLYECGPHGKYMRVRTPFLYPDGDRIDVYAETLGEVITFSDLGETLRWLRSQTLSEKLTTKQNQLLSDVLLTHGVELFRGELMVRTPMNDSLASALMRLAQACVRVADVWFTFRARAVEAFSDEVADFLFERVVPFERRERILGRSGSIWRPEFHVRAPRRSSLVFALSTGNKGMARRIAEHVLAAAYDLNHLAVGPEALRFVSLFDDSYDVWSAEDFRMLDDLTVITRWSDPDEFVDQLQAA